MAKVMPFEACHYNTQRFGKDITRLVAPPYDVIDRVLERRLKEDRLNIAHVTLGDEGDAYQVAARRLRTWLADEVLVKSPEKSLYIYEQTYASPDGTPMVRSGISGLVKLEGFSKGTVMPHEKTIPKHRQDRMAHMCAVAGDTEQVFMLYDDPTGEIEAIIQRERKREEELRFTDLDGVLHRIIRLSDPAVVQTVTDLLGPAKLLIADGHHRYETALEYRDAMRSKDGSREGDTAYDYILATLVSSGNRGLVVFPTHRLVQSVDEKLLKALPKKLEAEFNLKAFEGPDALAKAVEAHRGIAFGVWIPSAEVHVMAVPKKHAAGEKPMEGLPVYIVQEKVLKKHLGYTSDMLDMKVNIDYVKGTGSAKEATGSGEYQACFFIKPPSIEQVMAVATSGEKLPHKSTYFYPKIWSGTLLYLFQ